MKPKYGSFLAFERLLNVAFYTSSRDKLAQARTIFGRAGYYLRHFVGKREPYDEDYSSGTHELLERAIKQVTQDFSVRSMFFVEDTSVRIEALSNAKDVPGLEVKEWFSSTSFDELDRTIVLRGGDRRATIKSDIALYLPGLSRPLFFHGEVSGAVAPSAPKFKPQIQYPWLTPDSFNGWFIPDGSLRRLGEMEFEESLRYDFRARSLFSMLERLEELNSALNIAPVQYSVRRKAPSLSRQGTLFAEFQGQRRTWIVVGPKCAGKTTLADFIVQAENVVSIEASSVLRAIAEENGTQVSNANDAELFLRAHGMDVVARRLFEYLERSPAEINVVTGLRTLEEVEYLVTRLPSVSIILVDADVRVRFERHLRRARDIEVKTFVEFEELDRQQRRFGILEAPTELADIVLRNDGTMQEYQLRITEVMHNNVTTRSAGGEKAPSELHRCLAALSTSGKFMTCEQISDVTAEVGTRVRKYNTNRALKNAPLFAERNTTKGQYLRYRITPAGVRFLRLLETSYRK